MGTYITFWTFETLGWNKVQAEFDKYKWNIKSNFVAFLEKLKFNEEA